MNAFFQIRYFITLLGQICSNRNILFNNEFIDLKEGIFFDRFYFRRILLNRSRKHATWIMTCVTLCRLFRTQTITERAN